MNFEQWFMSKQGMPYDSMRVFAQDAWNAAVEAEREACAKVCDEQKVPDQILGAHPDYIEGKRMAFSQAASQIRARSNA